MSTSDGITPEQFAATFRRVAEWAQIQGLERESPFAKLLKGHFGADPKEFPITTESLAVHERPNLQLALDAYLSAPGRSAEVVGASTPHEGMEISLATAVHDWHGSGARIGPVRRTLVTLDAGRSISCVLAALYLVTDGERRVAVHVGPAQNNFGRPSIRVDVLAPEVEESEQVVADLRRLMDEHNVFRGKVIALGREDDGFGHSDFAVSFLSVPEVRREEIVLPAGVLDTLELHTVTFAEHQGALAAGGRHIRRGLLLHGPPGTGKTLTCSHLIRRLEGRTTVVLSGSGLGLIGPACALARDLQPALVVLEDIDLVAHERTYFEGGASSLLFELLNEIDGIGEDADVIFLMTTNRAELLEPALAARPGRVDQAVELPLPDADSRRRLLELFGRGLDLQLEDVDAIVERTEEVSAAFIRELVRKAALYAARDGSSKVTDGHVAEALDQLEAGGKLTRSLLGAARPEHEDELLDDAWDD